MGRPSIVRHLVSRQAVRAWPQRRGKRCRCIARKRPAKESRVCRQVSSRALPVTSRRCACFGFEVLLGLCSRSAVRDRNEARRVRLLRRLSPGLLRLQRASRRGLPRTRPRRSGQIRHHRHPVRAPPCVQRAKGTPEPACCPLPHPPFGRPGEFMAPASAVRHRRTAHGAGLRHAVPASRWR